MVFRRDGMRRTDYEQGTTLAAGGLLVDVRLMDDDGCDVVI